MRDIIKAIEHGTNKFASAYSFLDQLEAKMTATDDEEDQMLEECIRPIQKMLQNNRHSLLKLKENGESLMATLKQSGSRKNTQKTYTNEELDSEINYLTAVLKSKKMLR